MDNWLGVTGSFHDLPLMVKYMLVCIYLVPASMLGHLAADIVDPWEHGHCHRKLGSKRSWYAVVGFSMLAQLVIGVFLTIVFIVFAVFIPLCFKLMLEWLRYCIGYPLESMTAITIPIAAKYGQGLYRKCIGMPFSEENDPDYQ